MDQHIQTLDDNTSQHIDFDDNHLLAALMGAHSCHLAQIETSLNVSIDGRGNRLVIMGTAENCARTQQILQGLYQRLLSGEAIDKGDVEGAIRMSDPTLKQKKSAKIGKKGAGAIRTHKREIKSRTPMQAHYISTLKSHELTLGIGPAGTGKTYIAVAMAASMFLDGLVDRIILSRPAVEAGERLGFLPGDMRDKVDPYLRPLYDALHDMMPGQQVMRLLESGDIEIAPLAFMRGRTLSNAFVILDEAQNTTSMQMKMFLTRLGEGSRMAITGDPSQIDLPYGTQSGLREAMRILPAIKEVGVVTFGDEDIVRHGLVTKIVKAYNAHQGKLPMEDNPNANS